MSKVGNKPKIGGKVNCFTFPLVFCEAEQAPLLSEAKQALSGGKVNCFTFPLVFCEAEQAPLLSEAKQALSGGIK